jgi:hypothetical protein
VIAEGRLGHNEVFPDTLAASAAVALAAPAAPAPPAAPAKSYELPDGRGDEMAFPVSRTSNSESSSLPSVNKARTASMKARGQSS